MPRIILVDSSLLGREMLRTLVAGTDYVFLVGEYSNYETATLPSDGSVDGVVVGLDGDPPKALRLISTLRGKHPTLPIIVTSEQSHLLVQAHRQGASALLDCPVRMDAFMLALHSFGSGSNNNRAVAARTMAVMSSRGGVGCTTLAVN